jgi:hypothetical protein
MLEVDGVFDLKETQQRLRRMRLALARELVPRSDTT